MLPQRVFGERLRDELGPPLRHQKLASSPRSQVWRVELASGPVIVKQIVDGADARRRFGREIAALRLAARAAAPVVPRLIAVDDVACVMVLEWLDEGERRDGWQREYTAALARLHACGVGAAAGLPRWEPPDTDDVDDFLGLARGWGVTVSGGARTELAALVRRVSEPCVPALLHGDPCPSGNVMFTQDGPRFIDLEQSSTGSGLVELAYPRIGFPTCYDSPGTPVATLKDAEAVYREIWTESTGAPPSESLADACAAWTIRGDALVQLSQRGAQRYLRKLAAKNWKWGKATARERLAFRLEVTAEQSSESDDLAAVSALCRDMREAMRARWPRLRRLTDPALTY